MTFCPITRSVLVNKFSVVRSTFKPQEKSLEEKSKN